MSGRDDSFPADGSAHDPLWSGSNAPQPSCAACAR